MPMYVRTRNLIRGSFAVAGVPFDPDVVKLTYTYPIAGGKTAAEVLYYGVSDIVKDSVGHYSLEIFPKHAGVIKGFWESGSPTQEGAAEFTYVVEQRPL